MITEFNVSGILSPSSGHLYVCPHRGVGGSVTAGRTSSTLQWLIGRFWNIPGGLLKCWVGIPVGGKIYNES